MSHRIVLRVIYFAGITDEYYFGAPLDMFGWRLTDRTLIIKVQPKIERIEIPLVNIRRIEIEQILGSNE